MRLDDLCRRYASLSDDDLVRFAAERAGDLTDEALGALRSELTRRGLDGEADDAIDIQTRALTQPELDRLVEQFRHTPCPVCGISGGLLNAVVLTPQTLVVAESEARRTVVGCEACLSRATGRADTAAMVMGLFGTFGIVRAVQALFRKDDHRLERGEATLALVRYVTDNPGLALRAIERAGARQDPAF